MGIFGTIGGLFTGQTEGKVLGGLTNNFANSAGTPNNYQASTYGMTPQTWVPGTSGQSGNFFTGLLGGHMTGGGVDPSVAAAFNYQDPNAQQYDNAAGLAQAQQQNAYNQQQGLIGQLQQQANGTGPSLAATQMQAANDAGNRQALSLQASAAAQGVNPALAAQLAQNAQATNIQGNAQTAAQGRIAEQYNAQNALAGLTSGQQQLGAQQAAGYYGMGQNNTQYANTAQQNLQQLLSNNFNSAQGINSGVAAGNSSQHASLVGNLLGGAASIGQKAAA